MSKAFYPTNDGHIGNLEKLPNIVIKELLKRQQDLLKKKYVKIQINLLKYILNVMHDMDILNLKYTQEASYCLSVIAHGNKICTLPILQKKISL